MAVKRATHADLINDSLLQGENHVTEKHFGNSKLG